jgi:hypothetical protein
MVKEWLIAIPPRRPQKRLLIPPKKLSAARSNLGIVSFASRKTPCKKFARCSASVKLNKCPPKSSIKVQKQLVNNNIKINELIQLMEQYKKQMEMIFE